MWFECEINVLISLTRNQRVIIVKSCDINHVTEPEPHTRRHGHHTEYAIQGASYIELPIWKGTFVA